MITEEKIMTSDNSATFSKDEKNAANLNVHDIPLDTVISSSGKLVHIGTGIELDEALEFAKAHGHIDVTPQEDRKLCRKIDMIVLPLFAFLYMAQFMDKTCVVCSYYGY